MDEQLASLERAEVGHGSNVCAELGTTWLFLMRNPDEAAHTLGKLIKHMRPDNILYGSDCICSGSPQIQTQALTACQIAEQFQEQLSYPRMTARTKAKIFGLNAANVYGIDADEIRYRAQADAIHKLRENYRNDPRPHFETWGPKTRREFF